MCIRSVICKTTQTWAFSQFPSRLTAYQTGPPDYLCPTGQPVGGVKSTSTPAL